MKKKKIIIASLLFVILLVMIIIFFIDKDKKAKDNDFLQGIEKEANKSDIAEKPSEEDLIKLSPISYSLVGVSASVSTTTEPFGFTAEQLKKVAEKDCGTQHEVDYFDKLVTKFKGVSRIVYSFKYQGVSQDAGTYKVTLIPNRVGYTSLDQFRNDFNQCFAGGDAYPWKLNNDWLLFVSACGTGYDDDSGRPHGCYEVEKVVEPSLKLN